MLCVLEYSALSSDYYYIQLLNLMRWAEVVTSLSTIGTKAHEVGGEGESKTA